MVKHTLLESISDRPSINFQIERELKKHDPAMQTRILDALEAVKDAGPDGISVKDWAIRIRMLHPDEDHPVADLLRAVVGKFGCCIERLGDKRYGWVENDNEAGAAVPQGVQDAMGDQVRLTSIALKTIRELGEFTLVELASAIARKTGMPISSAVGFAQHIIKQFIGGTLATIGNDRYKVKSEQKKTSDEHVDDLKDLLRKSGLNPDEISEAGGIGGGMSGTKFSKAADYAPAVGAGVRGAVDNVTMGTGKYARAAADYGIKNLGSLAGISDPTTWDTEIDQEREKDLAAQQDHPVAWDIGDKAATAAQVASGVGAVKALGTAAIKAGAKAALRAGERRAALAALPKSGTYGGGNLSATFAAKRAAEDLKYRAMLMSNSELTNAIKTSKSPELMRELERRLAIEKLPNLPVVKDFQLGTHMPLKLTPQMRTTQSLKLTPQMRVAKNTLPPKLATQPTIPSGSNVIPFRPRPK